MLDKNGIETKVGEFMSGYMGNHMRGMDSRKEKKCLFLVLEDGTLKRMTPLPQAYKFYPKLNECWHEEISPNEPIESEG